MTRHASREGRGRAGPGSLRGVRVALYHGAGRLTLEERPDPVAGPGELVVRVRACGLCGSDLMRWYQDPRAPVVLGHEPAGEVVDAGPGAPFAPGDRVFVHHHVPCMTCALCRAGRHTLCETFRRTRLDPGGLAELIRVPAENARLDTLALPAGVSDSDATLIEPLGCVLRGQRWAGVAPGSRVAVIGAGAMGLLEIGAALAAGAERVVAVEPRADRRARALGSGAVAAFADDDPGAVSDALGGLADQVFVCTTKAEAIAGALHLAGPAGVVQLFAPPRPGTAVPLDLGAVFFREVTIQSTYSAGPLDTRDALALLAAGAIATDGLVSHLIPLEHVEEAFRLARSGEATKVVVLP